VAMGQAIQPVIDAADDVTASVYEGAWIAATEPPELFGSRLGTWLR
jgi:hypothetical protein